MPTISAALLTLIEAFKDHTYGYLCDEEKRLRPAKGELRVFCQDENVVGEGGQNLALEVSRGEIHLIYYRFAENNHGGGKWEECQRVRLVEHSNKPRTVRGACAELLGNLVGGVRSAD
jgi:hypothetical protein